MQVLNQTTRLELQLLQHSISTNKLEKQILDQTSEINKLQDKNRYSCYKILEIRTVPFPDTQATHDYKLSSPQMMDFCLEHIWVRGSENKRQGEFRKKF